MNIAVWSNKLFDNLKFLDKLRSSSAFQRNFVYPLAMLLLLFLTGITLLLVLQNTLELLIGIKALPLSTRVSISGVIYEILSRMMVTFAFFSSN